MSMNRALVGAGIALLAHIHCGSVLAQARQGSHQVALEEAVGSALAKSPRVAQSRSALESAKAARDGVASKSKPQVALGFAGQQQNTGSRGPSSTLDLTVTQTVYDWGLNRSELAAAESSVSQAGSSVEASQEAIALEVVAAYTELQRVQSLKNSAERLIAALAEIERIAQTRAASGFTSAVDATAASTRLVAAKATLANLAAQGAALEARLLSLSRLDAGPGLNLKPVAGDRFVIDAPLALDDAKVQAARHALESAQAKLEAAQAKPKPAILLEAQARQAMGGAFPNGRRLDTGIGFRVSTPVFDGGLAQAEIAAAAQAVESARADLELAQQESALQGAMAVAEISGLLGQLELIGDRGRSLNETKRIYRLQYLQSGNRSILDLLNIEQDLYALETEASTLNSTLINATARLYASRAHLPDLFVQGTK